MVWLTLIHSEDSNVCVSKGEHKGHRVARSGTEGSSAPPHRTIMTLPLLIPQHPSPSLPGLLSLVVLPTWLKPLFLLLLLFFFLMSCHVHSPHLSFAPAAVCPCPNKRAAPSHQSPSPGTRTFNQTRWSSCISKDAQKVINPGFLLWQKYIQEGRC